ASTNFFKALERIPALIEKYQSDNQKLEKDLPVLKEVMTATWKKEPELKDLKSQLDSLSRQINLSLENKDKNREQSVMPEQHVGNLKEVKSESSVKIAVKPDDEFQNIRSGQAMSIKDIVKINPDRIIIARPDTGNQKKSKGLGL
ncbi:hypothetical protein D0T84_21815, partial [Dysgonomonas sp. 521]|uniref:aminoacyltransferase n=1 Tax=Dysgonomonas sp. 521 TaxID=2302932 RepID=UPI0013D58DCA